jgi:hypothetical protein
MEAGSQEEGEIKRERISPYSMGSLCASAAGVFSAAIRSHLLVPGTGARETSSRWQSEWCS